MKKKRFSPVLLSIILLLLTVGCGKQTDEKLPLLRVGHALNDHHAPLFIAALNPDYFKKNGGTYLREVEFRKKYDLIHNDRIVAEVRFNSGTGGRKLVSRLITGEADMVLGGVPSALHYIDQGEGLRILSPVMTNGASLILRNDLTADTWDEFIAYARTTKTPLVIGYKAAVSTQNLIFETALKDAGIAYSKEVGNQTAPITLVNMFGAQNLVPSMKNELIDGFICNQPFPAMAETDGIGKTIVQLSELPPKGQWRGIPCCGLIATDSFTRAQQETSRLFATLLMRANLFINTNQPTAISQVSGWLNHPAAIEERSLPTINFLIDYDEAWTRGTNFWVKSMVELGKLNNRVSAAYQEGTLEKLIYDMDLYKQARDQI